MMSIISPYFQVFTKRYDYFMSNDIDCSPLIVNILNNKNSIIRIHWRYYLFIIKWKQ